jgi:hypothetical protein
MCWTCRAPDVLSGGSCALMTNPLRSTHREVKRAQCTHDKSFSCEAADLLYHSDCSRSALRETNNITEFRSQADHRWDPSNLVSEYQHRQLLRSSYGI